MDGNGNKVSGAARPGVLLVHERPRSVEAEGLAGALGGLGFAVDLGGAADIATRVGRPRDGAGAPVLLVGQGTAGAALLAAAADIPEAAAIACINAPADPAALDRLGHLRKALLILHAPLDTEVGIASAAHLFMAARHPKSFVSLDDADHGLSRAPDRDYVAAVIAAWAGRYVGAAPSAGDLVAPPDAVVVRETGQGKYANLVSVKGRHLLRADEPIGHGGTGTGPNPYDFLLAGLGACTAMTLRMYADHKGLPLERVSVTLSHEKIHAEDCSTCETRAGRVDVIEREIEIEGDLTPDQRRRMVEIADKCPVHRTLHSEVVVATHLKEG